jgi:hypothetical protein
MTITGKFKPMTRGRCSSLVTLRRHRQRWLLTKLAGRGLFRVSLGARTAIRADDTASDRESA